MSHEKQTRKLGMNFRGPLRYKSIEIDLGVEKNVRPVSLLSHPCTSKPGSLMKKEFISIISGKKTIQTSHFFVSSEYKDEQLAR